MPVEIAAPHDGSGRLFVAQQEGLIRIIRDGALEERPFLDIRSLTRARGESGLIGLAFPAQFGLTGRFYVTYVDRQSTFTISRFRCEPGADQADPATEEVILAIPHPNPIHFGGTLRFGPDGYLYAGLGDGGSTRDEDGNAQNPLSPFGKLLRIDVESGAVPYAVPPSNPFVNTPGFLPEIWAMGLRNPWKFSFDSATGDLYIGDVGEASREEVNFQPWYSPGGENYGWNLKEGDRCFSGYCDIPGLVDPVRTYGRDEGGSVTGGYVYRGSAIPVLRGCYIHGDFVSSYIWCMYFDGLEWQNGLVEEQQFSTSTFGEDDYGELYVADYDDGVIYRIDAAE